MDTVESLLFDLLEWIGPHPRPYAEVQEVWRTSCPRLPVWEEAMDRGYIETQFEAGRGRFVLVSPGGAALLAAHVRDRSQLGRA